MNNTQGKNLNLKYNSADNRDRKLALHPLNLKANHLILPSLARLDINSENDD